MSRFLKQHVVLLIFLQPEFEPEQNGTQVLAPMLKQKTSEIGHCGRNSMENASAEEKCVNSGLHCFDNKEELDDSDWEDGTVARDDHPVTIELNMTAHSTVQKQIRRASAEDKVNCYRTEVGFNTKITFGHVLKVIL